MTLTNQFPGTPECWKARRELTEDLGPVNPMREHSLLTCRCLLVPGMICRIIGRRWAIHVIRRGKQGAEPGCQLSIIQVVIEQRPDGLSQIAAS